MFDAGHRVASLPMATALRVLVHDTDRSKSVLTQLGEKERLQFADTAAHIDPGNLLPTPGLVLAKVTAGSGADWVPPLDGELLGPHRQQPPLPFGRWWTMPITKVHGPKGGTWSRKSFVLHIANKEGGAHVDPEEPEATIRSLEEHNALGFQYLDPVIGDQPMLNGPVLPSVRQIGLEVQRTIEPLLQAE